MSTTFTGYSDAFTVTQGSTSAEESSFNNPDRALRKAKKINKKLKQIIKEQRIAEKKRIAEEQRAAEEKRIAEEARKKEPSFLSKLGDSVLKVIGPMLMAVVPLFLKGLFSRRKGYKFA